MVSPRRAADFLEAGHRWSPEQPDKGASSRDRRGLTPMDRSSYPWEREYTQRRVKQVNSRLDVPFGFELHRIRGIAKMRSRCGVALLVMVGMALGCIQQNHPDTALQFNP